MRLLALPFAALMLAPVEAQTVGDRMLCEWIAPCTDEACETGLSNPTYTLQRVGDTWMWDPLAEWNGFPIGLVETLSEAEALARVEEPEIGLILVPMGHTSDGALILDGYGFQFFPARGLAPRAMRHHCVPVSEVTS